MSESHEVTLLLERAVAGDNAAVDELVPIVYDELRRLAGAAMGGQAHGHTLQATALANEAYLKLVRADQPFADRVHFMAVASLAMRQILTDHARRKKAAKRGGGAFKADLPIEAVAVDSRGGVLDPVDLADAMERLGAMNERHRRIVELRFFGGLTMEQIAGLLGVSLSTVEADWRAARAWLTVELGASDR